jgi:thiol-disulfide isomerase/thioredoxin
MLLLLGTFSFGQMVGLAPQNVMTIEEGLQARQQISLKADNSREVNVEITPTNAYLSGTTMELNFHLSFSTVTNEYGDSLAMTFPEGFTILDGSPQMGVATQGQSAETLNGIEGQTISWGDNDNTWGGIQPGEIDFFVKVEVDTDLLGDQMIKAYFSGDEYGGVAPHDAEMEITVKRVPDTPDLIPHALGFLAEYEAVPLDQASFMPKASIVNKGTKLEEDVYAYAMAGNYKDSIKIKNPLELDNADSVDFALFTASDTGMLEFKFSANASDDAYPENGTTAKNIHINKTHLIRDNGEIAGFIGASSTKAGGAIGAVFTLQKKDTLNSMDIFLGAAQIGDKLKCVVFSMGAEGPEDELAVSLEFPVINQGAEYRAYFKEGVVLEAGTYLFGVEEDLGSMQIAYTTDEFVPNTAWYRNPTSGAWMDIGLMGFNHTYYIRPGFGTETPEFDIQLTDLKVDPYMVAGNKQSIGATIFNASIEELTKIDLVYSVNGGEQVSTTIATNIAGQNSHYIELSDELDITAVGNYDLEVFIASPNGKIDVDATNDTLQTSFYAMSKATTKKVFAEEGTGTWCGWCVRGFVYIDSMKQKYEDDFIVAAVHSGDPMATEYVQYLNPHLKGYPGAVMDRAVGAIDPMDFEEYYLKQMEKVSPADVNVLNVKYDEETRMLSFDVAADFLAPAKNMRLNASVLENKVTGLDKGFAQSNYYTGGNYGPMAGYENMPYKIAAEDMVYDHVGRALAAGWNGKEGSLPENIEANSNHTQTFEVELGKDWNPGEISIVGYIVDQESGEVVNSLEIDTELNAQYKVSFRTQAADSSDLKEVNIIMGEDTVTTNKYGYAYQFFDNGEYEYTAEFGDTLVKKGSFTIDGEDIVVVITNEAPTHIVEFTVLHNTEAVEGAEITIGEALVTTNESGVATFNLENGTYDYTVNAEGLDGATGQVVVDGKDESITVVLTSFAEEISFTYNVYPNPFADRLMIDNITQVKEIQLVNSLGETVLKEFPRSNTLIFNTSNLPSGFYMLKVMSYHGTLQTTKVVK